jgi:hypothetical protein
MKTHVARKAVAGLFLGIVVAGATGLTSRRAAACGGGGVTSQSSGVVANAQRILMSVHAATTDVVVQIGVPATTADYGVLIPAPSQPTLDAQPVSEADLAALDAATAPTIFVQQAAGSSEGCGCFGSASNKGGGLGRGVDAGVSVSAPVNIGPVQAVVLTADTADAVNAWLADNGFALPADGQAIVGSYAGTGKYFIAIRRSDTAASGAATSIGVHYTLPGAHQKLSLGFARLGAAPSVAFTLWNATGGPSAPLSPFVPLLLSALDTPTLRQGHYADAVAAAVAAHDSQAFVLEGQTDKATLAGKQVGAALLGLVDDGATITRMSTIVAAAALTDDATFGAYTGGFIPGTVYVQGAARAVSYASAGLLPVLAIATAWRRRARRRARASALAGVKAPKGR